MTSDRKKMLFLPAQENQTKNVSKEKKMLFEEKKTRTQTCFLLEEFGFFWSSEVVFVLFVSKKLLLLLKHFFCFALFFLFSLNDYFNSSNLCFTSLFQQGLLKENSFSSKKTQNQHKTWLSLTFL